MQLHNILYRIFLLNNKLIRSLPIFSLAACILFTACGGTAPVTSTVKTTNQPYSGTPAATSTSPTTTAAAPSSTPEPIVTGEPSLPAAENNPTIVIGVDGIFYPMSLTVSAGTKVDFKNEDCCNYHKLWSDAPFTMNMDPLALIPFNFNKPGTYKFWLDGVQWVYGTVTVT